MKKVELMSPPPGPPAMHIDATRPDEKGATRVSTLRNAHRNNGFDFLRIIAAVMVIYGHSAALTGSAVYGVLGNSLSTIGVKIFFVTSGFLITRSWIFDPSVTRFVMRRMLRIMPGLACVVLVTLLVLGPVFTKLSLSAYFADAGTWRYLWNVALYPIYNLPGVFAQTKYPVAVNGSLWSLPAEVLMYILTPFVLGRGQMGGRIAILLSAVSFAAAGIYYLRIVSVTPQPVIYGTSLISVLDVAAYFQIGAVYAVFRLERYGRPLLSLAMLIVAAWLVRLMPASSAPLAEFLLLLLLPFAVISIGCQRLRWIEKPLALGDVSYGLYLYGFPIQQALMAFSGNAYDTRDEFLLTLPLTFVCAVLSWLLIERYALIWKPRKRIS